MNLSNFGAVRHSLLSAAVLAFLAASASAQIVEKERTFADLTASHPCSSGYTGRNAIVTDCDAADDIGDGGGAFRCFAHCDGSAPWEAVSIGGGAGDLSGYVLLAGSESGQVIYGYSGSPNNARLSMTEGAVLKDGGSTAYTFMEAGVYGGNAFLRSTSNEIMQGEVLVTGGQILQRVRTAEGAETAYLSLEVSSGFSVETSATGSKIAVTPTDGFIVVTATTPPTNANDTCTIGTFIITETFIYYCVSDQVWVRAAMATW